ncbi:hypothetical protein CHLNCDRAFT_143460 [Chlorella variabilis]|uniref:3'-5' exonuclease domain-containing protein n=1 Tax=Chlorella variabilis TaxID=554065 RepID=E1ZAY7_CHLVA|nr:hypothetical protein CHLNCDRAFT_143460 [Chlorella variabilis]EFN56933.1 hypothetical protein CHLNCDRAFT_143460 [Chlorella variabilis]|eukprot:XP_005849035.1 hypothetical protein CHLNCDRAFT_143460 [Chlorella variabilis]
MRGGKRIAWQPQPPTHQAVAAALTVATAEPQPPTPRRSSGRNCKRRAEWEVEVDAEPEPEPAVPLQAAAAPRQPRRRKKARRVVSLEEPEPEPAVPQPPTPPGLAAAAAHDAELRPAPCAGCPLYTLPGGVTVAVVSRQEHLAPALMLLRDSMPTPYIAIDLEWPSTDVPAYSHSFQGVALVQLASADTCVLVRTCLLGFPRELSNFLRDPSICFIGMHWGTQDADKMHDSFGWHHCDFHGGFVDAGTRSMARQAGYPRPGLKGMAESLFAIDLPKSKKARTYFWKRVTLSNWAAASLSGSQVRYAALDALFTFHIYEALAAAADANS